MVFLCLFFQCAYPGRSSILFKASIGDGRVSEGVDRSLTCLVLASVLDMSSCVGILATAGSEGYSVPLS